jgi:putative endonuclease
VGRRPTRAGDAALSPLPPSAAPTVTVALPPATAASSATPHWAEALARRALERLGWTTIAANARTRGGEIDLVMADGDVVVFVEVRQRAGGAHGGAAESLDGRKRARVRRAAAQWLARHGRHDDAVRFDAVLVDGAPDGPRVRLVRDAF